MPLLSQQWTAPAKPKCPEEASALVMEGLKQCEQSGPICAPSATDSSWHFEFTCSRQLLTAISAKRGRMLCAPMQELDKGAAGRSWAAVSADRRFAPTVTQACMHEQQDSRDSRTVQEQL